MEKQLKYLGIVSIIIGVITAVTCFFSLFLALPLGFLGMICSSIYVYIDTKNEINSKSITPGIIAMALSSAPVILILSILVYGYLNHH